MRKRYFVWLVFAVVAFSWSCSNGHKTASGSDTASENKICQAKDGSISLKVDKAQCYQDVVNPSSNTAEWNVLVSKSGRFDVWLASATKDTTNLKYKNSVMLSISENRLEKRPLCDKIILHSEDVSYPYFRADSFLGSLYIQDTGIYNIQVISEKILPTDYEGNDTSLSDGTKLLQVYLKPSTR